MALQRQRSLRCVILGGLRWVGVRLGEGGREGGGEGERGGARAPEIAEEIHEGLHLLLLGKGSLPCHAYQMMATREEGFLRETPALQRPEFQEPRRRSSGGEDLKLKLS